MEINEKYKQNRTIIVLMVYMGGMYRTYDTETYQEIAKQINANKQTNKHGSNVENIR